TMAGTRRTEGLLQILYHCTVFRKNRFLRVMICSPSSDFWETISMLHSFCRSSIVFILFFVARFAGAQTLAERLTPLIAAHEGDVAVAVKHLKKGDSFTYKADEPMPTASLIKLPVMVEAYRQAAEGKIDLNSPVTFKEEDKTPGSGILSTQFSPGASFTLRDSIRLMIAYSDNSATNLVLAKIGLPATNELMEKLGLPNTKVHAFVFRPMSSIAPDRSRQFGLGSTTANEM